MVSLLDCNNTLIATKDSPNGMYGFEHIFINTQLACDHTLKIKRFKSKRNALQGKVSILVKDITRSPDDTIVSKGFAFSKGRPDENGRMYLCCNTKFGIIGKSDSVIIPPKYDREIGEMKEGLYRAESNKKVGFLDKNNKIVIPFKYDTDTARMIGLMGMTLATESGDTYNMAETDITRLGFSNGLCAVIVNNKYGFIDATGKTVIKFKYEGVDNFLNGLAIVKTNARYGAIDTRGRFVIPPVYEMLMWTEDQLLYAIKDKESYLMDGKQNRVHK